MPETGKYKHLKDYAIGIFDSGLGGLTVVKELIKRLPNENIVYYGDTARVPYGIKSRESIIRFSVENAEILISKNIKMIVVACNSSSSYALETLKRRFDVPVVGVIEPGARKAVELTENNRIGVIATSATISSGKYIDAVKKNSGVVRLFSKACPLFVPLVEDGWSNKKVTEDIASEYLSQLAKQNIDTLILGCTHYPLLKNVISKVLGKGVFLVDSAKEVVLEIKRILESGDRKRISKQKAVRRFFVSDKPQNFKKIAGDFLGCEIGRVVHLRRMNV